MNLQIKAVCKTAKIRKHNTCIIGIHYCLINERRVKLDSGLSVPPQYWNPKKQCIMESLPPEFGDTAVLNKKLIGELRKGEHKPLNPIENQINDEIHILYYLQSAISVSVFLFLSLCKHLSQRSVSSYKFNVE